MIMLRAQVIGSLLLRKRLSHHQFQRLKIGSCFYDDIADHLQLWFYLKEYLPRYCSNQIMVFLHIYQPTILRAIVLLLENLRGKDYLLLELLPMHIHTQKYNILHSLGVQC
ncbi:hypothetical protein lpg0538 [Legionella pneumophila subsp. pneumophila str. Philadelphia 1]|uniref:Uncharacterized protein n=1 Tax=Legionella pneumophila subsp. pneumophila (strain Philadelphia 1 / ATCC 33152 / DSM 7513) TaxID=272624 RepID=Q5ZY35_LEGPH|nr:hypothetical protein lpg0538 [Legionella pneumophila subsp. pneumophila str. Philadelphia 1]AEW50820.1 hypothetical protein lp12_0543 [Legionella pneumophila subsp. pneumophila ATCC 43290]